jgi:hypothetical protein
MTSPDQNLAVYPAYRPALRKRPERMVITGRLRHCRAAAGGGAPTDTPTRPNDENFITSQSWNYRLTNRDDT